VIPLDPALLQFDIASGDFRGLLFLGTFVMVTGFFLTIHGAAAYALLLWEWTAGAVVWVYLDWRLGAFFFLAGIIQFPLATHLWGDPVRYHLKRVISNTLGS
jgi:hypothetical protein